MVLEPKEKTFLIWAEESSTLRRLYRVGLEDLHLQSIPNHFLCNIDRLYSYLSCYILVFSSQYTYSSLDQVSSRPVINILYMVNRTGLFQDVIKMHLK
jgi:hypothetical protein